MPSDDLEVRACRARGFRAMLYAELLGLLSAHSATLAVAGTHGKTTTAALLAAALRAGGIDASHVIGGDVPELGGSGHAGASPWMVVEACEFDRSFHHLHPRAAAILNVDQDHFDCYPTASDLHEAYAEVARRLPRDGVAVLGSEVPKPIAQAARCPVLRVGEDERADWRPAAIRHDFGRYSFVPVTRSGPLPRVSLRVPGRFQIGNALVALALASFAGADPEDACRGVSAFAGVRRRFEVQIGLRGGVLIHDYAHHPAELAAVLAAARQRFPGRRRVAVFQPHQHRRTAELLERFAEVLASHAELVLVADIYGAREPAAIRALVSAGDLVAAISARGGMAERAGGLDGLAERVAARASPGDVVLLLGAGDIESIVPDVQAQL